jgi:putative flippase GtrA
MKLIANYSLFALLATLSNIAAQDVTVHYYNGVYAIELSVIVGTAIGLIIKYILDKHYIFKFQSKSAAHNGKTFILYTLMGILTTLIFWGFEFGFNHIFQTKQMRYLGGIIGLSIGYIAKYHLDKHFVFRTSKVKP